MGAWLVCLAPAVLLVAGLWNRQVGLRESFNLTVERYLPSAVELDQLPALPTEAKDPDVMMVMLGVGAPQPLLGFLHALGEVGFRREEPQGRFAVMFRETLDAALLQELKPHPPTTLRVMAKWGKDSQEIGAEPGKVLQVGAGTFRVVALYPDFEVKSDAQGRPVMGSRSLEPRDPWLEMEYTRQGSPAQRVLLSARQPDLTRRLNAPNLPEGLVLDYLRDGEEQQTRFVVFSRQDRSVSLVENGAITRSETTATNRPFVVASGLSVTALGFFDRFYPAPTLAGGAPALRMKIEDVGRGKVERIWLRPTDSPQAALLENKIHLGFLPPAKDAKAIRLEMRVKDERGVDWPPREVKWLDPTSSTATVHLHFQRRPAAWLAWTALGMFLLGVGGLLAYSRRPASKAVV
ncbi:MAG: hypothetical protein Q8O00_08200 [Holophaga sp.]|nr:hypothetical protein [Holophaga sp.]